MDYYCLVMKFINAFLIFKKIIPCHQTVIVFIVID